MEGRVCVCVFVQCCWVFLARSGATVVSKCQKWLTAIFPNERFTVHQLGRVCSRCTGSLEFKNRQVLEFLVRLHP